MVVIAAAILKESGKTRKSPERSYGPSPPNRPATCLLEKVRKVRGGTEAEVRITAALFRARYHPNSLRHLCLDFSKTDL